MTGNQIADSNYDDPMRSGQPKPCRRDYMGSVLVLSLLDDGAGPIRSRYHRRPIHPGPILVCALVAYFPRLGWICASSVIKALSCGTYLTVKWNELVHASPLPAELRPVVRTVSAGPARYAQVLAVLHTDGDGFARGRQRRRTEHR